MQKVKAKKYLGQHFLKDPKIAESIVEALSFKGYEDVIELGPGMGALTDHLLKKKVPLVLIEIDAQSVDFLKNKHPLLSDSIFQEDFLAWNPREKISKPFALIGNFPYNISSQIIFRVLEYKELIVECVGMFQKEVAERLASDKGNKVYGLLSVLLQAFYQVTYLFSVERESFSPPPQVKSAVIRLQRKEKTFEFDENLFFKLVKSAFNQRRKTLRNALKPISLNKGFYELPILHKRAEQLSVEEFIELTIKAKAIGANT